MKIRFPRPDRGLALSLALSAVILAAGLYSALASPWSRTSASPHPHSTGYGVHPEDLVPVTKSSQMVVQGKVLEVYPAEWTTPSKNAPLRLQDMFTDQSIQLRTPVLLEVDQVHKGRGVPGALYLTLPGGHDGDLHMSSPLGVELAKGDEILAFLSVAPKDAGPWSEISPIYPQLILHVDGETLFGPEKTVSRSTVLNQIERAAQ